MTWGLAQAGNRAGRTGRYLHRWESEPEWNAVTSALRNPYDAASFLLCWLRRLAGKTRSLLSPNAPAPKSSALRGAVGCGLGVSPRGFESHRCRFASSACHAALGLGPALHLGCLRGRSLGTSWCKSIMPSELKSQDLIIIILLGAQAP